MHKREEYLNETFTGPDMQSHLEYCASQYPYNPAAGLTCTSCKQLIIVGWYCNRCGSCIIDYTLLVAHNR
jgi:hypothetical protein